MPMARATACAARRGAVRRPVLTRSLAIAAAVGTALNLIIQATRCSPGAS